MRRICLTLVAVLAVLAVGGGVAALTSGSSSDPRVWVHHEPSTFRTACGSSDCRPEGIVVYWSNLNFPNTTGYYTFVNGRQVGSPSSPPYTFDGMDCGIAVKLGVEAHDRSRNHSQLYTLQYKTPVCSGTRGSSPPADPSPSPRSVNTFCNIPAAYNNLKTGPHLCGWPDSTNVGYVNAPGYPGSLTAASSSSSSCPTTPQSNHTYSFCSYPGLTLPPGLTNVTFYGDEFHSNAVNNANVWGGHGDNNITFDYDTFQPNVAAPPVSCSESYQYGIYNEGGQIGQLTVTHSDFWGFGNAIDTEGSTQSAPQVFRYNWIHDASTDESPCYYHNDGIGMLNGGSESYAVVDHNTIEFVGNTNLIAWQNGNYTHDQNTNNLLSGDNESYAGARCSSGCTPATYIQTTGNTFNTYLPIVNGPLDATGHFWANTGSTWNHNYWAVPPGANWGNPAHNGWFWVPTTASNYPNDTGFISRTDHSR